MSVIPLVVQGPQKTVARSEQEFQECGGRDGRAVLIRPFDETQLDVAEPNPSDKQKPAVRKPNLSYDLRVGELFMDHRDLWTEPLQHGEKIKLRPGGAVVIRTQETLHVPKRMFGYIVPRVYWLKQGISNTMSKVDPGYDGHLLVTLFNLGKRTVDVEHGERFCSMVLHTVGTDAVPYDDKGKEIESDRKQRFWHKVRDEMEANQPLLMVILILVTTLVGIAQLLTYLALRASRVGG